MSIYKIFKGICISALRNNLLYRFFAIGIRKYQFYVHLNWPLFIFFTSNNSWRDYINRRNESSEHCETSSPSSRNGIWLQRFNNYTDDEIFASQQLFQILKTFKDNYFNELNVYETLDFPDEYDETTDEEDSIDEELSCEEESVDDSDENQSLEIRNTFTLEEMQDIVEWVDHHPNYKLTSIKNRFRKVKYMYMSQDFESIFKRTDQGLKRWKRSKNSCRMNFTQNEQQKKKQFTTVI